MGYLCKHVSRFSQVIAVDAHFDLFTRAWYISELAKAHASGMHQHLKLLNFQAVVQHAPRLSSLRVEDMTASRLEDVADILAGIPDKDAFNQQLHILIFDKLIPQWRNLDAHEQMHTLGRIARWQRVVDNCPGWSLGMYADRQDRES